MLKLLLMKPKKSNALKFFVAIFIAIFVFTPIFHFSLLTFNYAHAGVPKILSFQGRLTDASGNLLGSSGTNYYFKFAIFNSLTGGTQLWPSTAIADSTAVTLKVTQGVFNALLGDTTAGFEAIGLDFATSNYFLEVRVSELGSTFDTLTPRQRIVASGFAVNADTVHGGLFINASGVGQFGGLTTVSYSRFGTDTTSHAGTIIDANDLLVSGGLEVNGSASFDGFALFGGNASVSGNFEVSGTGSSSFAGSLDITKGLHVSGGSTIANTLGIIKAISNAQLNIQQSSTLNAGFYVDSSGDLRLSTTGENIRMNDNNLWVCIGSCALEVTPPAGDGNIIMESSLIFDDNSFKFKQNTASTSFQDSINAQVLIFDESQ